MIRVREAGKRGYANHGWLKSYHTFSFADYYDPAEMGFGPLRVINEDRVDPSQGFPTHGHRDMEIISYVLSGELSHKDSMGNGSVIRPGYVQKMSAGTGVRHSEYNASSTQLVHFLQIWIQPNVNGIAPNYEEKLFPEEDKRGKLRLVASPDARDGSVRLYQDAWVYATLLDGDPPLTFALRPGRRAYLHLVRGELTVNETALKTGDAAKITDENAIVLTNGKAAEALLFDLP